MSKRFVVPENYPSFLKKATDVDTLILKEKIKSYEKS